MHLSHCKSDRAQDRGIASGEDSTTEKTTTCPLFYFFFLSEDVAHRLLFALAVVVVAVVVVLAVVNYECWIVASVEHLGHAKWHAWARRGTRDPRPDTRDQEPGTV